MALWRPISLCDLFATDTRVTNHNCQRNLKEKMLLRKSRYIVGQATSSMSGGRGLLFMGEEGIDQVTLVKL
jgi:hypothetical protein